MTRYMMTMFFKADVFLLLILGLQLLQALDRYETDKFFYELKFTDTTKQSSSSLNKNSYEYENETNYIGTETTFIESINKSPGGITSERLNVVSLIPSTKVAGSGTAYALNETTNTPGLNFLGDIPFKSHPLAYAYDESLDSLLKSDSISNLKHEEKEHTKRESLFTSGEKLDKIKLKSIEQIQLGLPPQVLKSKKLKIIKGEKLLICRENQDGGTVEIILMDSLLQHRKYFATGNEPCNIQSEGNDIKLLHVIHKEYPFIIVSKLKGTSFVELQRIGIPGKRLIDITSWQQYGRFFILVKTNLINPTSSVPSMKFLLYGLNDDKSELIQEFDGSTTGMPHHFQIGFDFFLAIPNFNANETEILKYSFTQNKYVLFQKLDTRKATSVSTIKTENTFYLLVTKYCQEKTEICDPNTKSIIFKYNDEEFQLNNYIPTTSAITSVAIEHEKIVWLIVLSSLKGITIYRLHDSGIEEIFPEVGYELQSRGLSELVRFNIGSESYVGVKPILGADPSWMFFRITFDKENGKINPYDVRNWCHNSLKALNKKFELVENKIKETSLKESNTKNSYEKFIDKVIDDSTISNFNERVKEIEAESLRLESKVMTIENKVSDGINIHETTEWPDGLHFSSTAILAAKIDSFFVKNIDEQKIPSIEELIPLNNKDELNLHTKKFSNLDFNHELRIENLNDQPLSSYVTLDGNHTLKSIVSFKQIETPKLKVGGLIDGVKVGKDSILLNSGNSYFNGSLTCRSISATNIETDYINEVNIRKLMSNAFVENSSVIIKGNLEIRGDLIYPGNLKAGSILGKSTKYFTDNILYLDSGYPQVITGHYHINTMNTKELQIKNNLNGLKFPKSIFINLPVKIYHIPKAKFENLSAKKVWVDKKLNGIKVLDGELDIITLRGDQIVTGRKSFDGMHLKNYIVIKNQTTTELEKLQEIRMNTTMNKELQFYKTSIKSKDTLGTENTMLHSLLIARTKLMKLIDTQPRNMKESIMSETNYHFINEVLSRLNADVVELLNHLKTKNFIGIENVLEISQNDVVQLSRLSTFKTLPKYLISTVTKFYNDLEKVYDTIKILIDNKKKIISTLEENINIFEKRIRKEVERYNARNIGYKGSFVRGLVNGYDLSKVSHRKRNKALIKESEILEKVSRADLVTFMKGLITPNINKVNLARLLDEAVPFSFNDTNLNLLFEDTVVIQKNVETPYINNNVVSELAKINKINIFTKGVEFEDVRFFTDVEVKGSVNNFKLEETAARIARTDKNQKFTVPISFNSVDADRIQASNIYLNNLPLEEYALAGGNIIITGKKKFTNISALNSLVRIENLHTEELDRINLRSRMENRRKVEKDITTDDGISLDKLSIKGNIYIQRYIRDFNHGSLNITSLFEDAVLKDRNETINGSLVLEGDIKVEELNFKTTFDGISSETLDTFVLQKEDQHLYETNVFKTLRVKNLVIKDKLIQGISLQKLFSDSVKIDEDHVFSERVYFGNITSRKAKVSGLVQGKNLTSEAVLYTKPSIITGKKIFSSLVTTSSEITVNGMVNNITLGQVCKDITGEVEIKGSVNFEKDLIIDSLQIGSYLIPNNYSFYWTKDSNVKIDNHMVFNEIESKGIFISGKLNDEPISSLLDGPIPSNCKEPLKFSDLTVHTLAANNVNVKNLQTQTLEDEDSKILEKIILNSFDQSFENLQVNDLSVTGEIDVNNFLNEFKISDFCVRGHACEIKAPKIFYDNMNILNSWNIEDDSRINNIKIQDMKISDSFNADIVVIKGSLNVPSLSVEGLVQGMKFDKDTVMTHTMPQTMKGSFFISNKDNIAFEANDATVLSKTFNGIDINVLELQRQTTEEYNNEDLNRLKNLTEKYHNLRKHTIGVSSVLKDQPMRFDGWELAAKFEEVESIRPIEQQKESKMFLLALSSPKGIYLKNYIPHLKKLKDYVYIKINCTEDIKGFYVENDLYICASVSCPNPNANRSTSITVSPSNVPVNEEIFSYLWEITPTIPVLYAAIATSQVDQILTFKISHRNCMLFLSSYKEEQNILCEDRRSLILQQTLIIKGAIKALHFTYTSSNQNQIPVLIIATEEASNELPVIKVMQLSHKSNHYETIQEIQADRLTWILSSDINGIQLLASVHKPFIGSVEGHINIYRLQETSLSGDNGSDVGFDLRFDLQESIYLDDPLQATFLDSLSNEIFLLVLNKNEFIMRYVKRGYGKFQFSGSMHIPGAKSISSWVWKEINSYNLAVSVEESCTNGRLNNSIVYVFNPLYCGRPHIASVLH